MSDHISKNKQAKAGHANTTGIKLKPVTGATKLTLEGAKAAVANSDMNDKVPDTDREMDLTFYDANGNVETADPDGDISMEDDTTMQSIEDDNDASSSIDEPVSADTSITSASDGIVEQYDGASASIEDLFSSDDDMPNASGSLDEDSASVASSAPKLFNRGVRGHSVSLTKDSENSVSVEDRGYYSEDDGENYEYNKYAFRQKRLRLKNKAQRSKQSPSKIPKGGKGVHMKDGSMVAFNAANQRCDEQRLSRIPKGGKGVRMKDGRIVAFNAANKRCDDLACDGDSEMP